MNHRVTVRLEPSGREMMVASNTSLVDVLLRCGFEFPCGGAATCGKCRVRVINGDLDPKPDDFELLGRSAVEYGWRLACRATVEHRVTLQLAQWDAEVLMDQSPLAIVPRDALGVAIDLGTTTIAAQLVDLSDGTILSVRSGLNPQTSFGADIMSRLRCAVVDEKADTLTTMIREYLGRIVCELLADVEQLGEARKPLSEVVIVGNTVMHHLFCGLDLTPLASSPFDTSNLAGQCFTKSQLQWPIAGTPMIRFMPCLGGFIGSDVLAGILACELDRSSELQVLIDLGTNGEIVVFGHGQWLCAATAAGPAFEGARILMGMRAATGAIDRVKVIAPNHGLRQLGVGEEDCSLSIEVHVIGNGQPKGICGSGLIDAVACARMLGLLAPSGRLTNGSNRLSLTDGVSLHQCDIRELQLAKGAIAAGVEVLLNKIDCRANDVTRVYLCGAFGNFLDIRNATYIGLVPCAPQTVVAMGNTALRGAKQILLSGKSIEDRISKITHQVRSFGLSEDPGFMDVYVRHMVFPE